MKDPVNIVKMAVQSAATDISDAMFDGVDSKTAREFKDMVSLVLSTVCDAMSSDDAKWVDASADDSWLRKAADPVSTYAPDLSSMDHAKLLAIYQKVYGGEESLVKSIESRMKSDPAFSAELGKIVGPLPPKTEHPALSGEAPALAEGLPVEKPRHVVEHKPEHKPAPNIPPPPEPKRTEKMPPFGIRPEDSEFSSEKPKPGITPGAE